MLVQHSDQPPLDRHKFRYQFWDHILSPARWAGFLHVPIAQRELALGSVLGFEEHSLCAMTYTCTQPLFDIRSALLVQEDHSYTFKTVDQPYRRENDHLPYGPKFVR